MLESLTPPSVHAPRAAAPIAPTHSGARASERLPGIVGTSAPMRALARRVHAAAALGFPVLVRGESGTGKELVARAIHVLSPRAAGPLICLNGATLRDDLAMSALLGHARGAFTGASSRRQGAFAKAHGGTLFLDEVAALRPAVQAQLLRVVEEGRFAPLGDDEEVTVDVRIVTATCEPLETRVNQGRFRRDLYERLAACRLRVPPLRERRDDLPALTARLMTQGELRRFELTREGLDALGHYGFPGNVRELRNVLIQAALHAHGARLGAAEVEASLACRSTPDAVMPDLEEVLRGCGGNVSAAARSLGLARTTLRDRLRKLRSGR